MTTRLLPTDTAPCLIDRLRAGDPLLMGPEQKALDIVYTALVQNLVRLPATVAFSLSEWDLGQGSRGCAYSANREQVAMALRAKLAAEGLAVDQCTIEHGYKRLRGADGDPDYNQGYFHVRVNLRDPDAATPRLLSTPTP